MTDFKKPLDDLAGEVREYVDLRVDDIKLKTTKGLSVSLARVLTALVLLFTLGMVVLTFTVGFILMLGQVTGNYALGAFIALGVFIAVLIVLFALRNRLFTGTFVRMFIQIFFPEDHE